MPVILFIISVNASSQVIGISGGLGVNSMSKTAMGMKVAFGSHFAFEAVGSSARFQGGYAANFSGYIGNVSKFQGMVGVEYGRFFSARFYREYANGARSTYYIGNSNFVAPRLGLRKLVLPDKRVEIIFFCSWRIALPGNHYEFQGDTFNEKYDNTVRNSQSTKLGIGLSTVLYLGEIVKK